MRKLIYIATLLFLLHSSCIFSQTDNPTPTGSNKDAKDNFTLGNFKGALDDYLLLIKNDSDNATYNFHLGVCYLYTNIDKSKAIHYLEKAVANPKAEINSWYEMGHAYLLNYRMDDAITAFNKYKQLTNGKEFFPISADRMIQMCEDAKIQIKSPVNVTIENLGPQVNSAFADYNPYISSDESYMVFTSRRTGNTGNLLDFDGYLTADVYIAYQKNDKWGKAKNIGGNINSELVEETAGMSSDGNSLFLSVYNYTAMGQVLLSEKKGKTYQKPDFIGKNMNAIKLVKSATISPDKKILVYSCDLNDENGGLDLYMSRKLPSGEWGPPENLGEPVNTVYDEDFPYFAADGKTLYFSSQGHNSMGGYDIFKTYYDKKNNTWSEPENLGYPINTTDDDMTISFSATGRHGYISSLRPEGYGNLDIYKVIFNDVEPAYTAYSCTLVNKDSVNIFKVINKKEVKVDTASSGITVKKDTLNKSKVIQKKVEKNDITSGALIKKDTVSKSKVNKKKLVKADTTLSGNFVNKNSVSISKVIKKKEEKPDTTNSATNITINKDKNDNKDSLNIPKIEIPKEIKVDIIVFDNNTKKFFGKYVPNKKNGKFLIILPPGDYELNVNADGYEKYSENIKVLERAQNSEITKDIVLTPLSTEVKKN